MPELNISPTSDTLSSSLAAAVMRRITLPKFISASGTANSIKIDEIKLGNATVGLVDAENVKIELDTGTVTLKNVRSLVTLRITFNYGIRIPLPWPFDDFTLDGSTTVQPDAFAFEIGDINIPTLDDIELDIPSATLENIEASLEPVKNLDLGSAALKGLSLNDTVLPAAGFGLGGMAMGSITLRDVTVPSVSSARLSLEEFSPDAPLVLPSISLKNIQLPSTSAPTTSSEGTIIVQNVTAERRPIPLISGLLTASIDIEPTLDIAIESMDIENISARSSIEKINLHDIQSSVQISDVTVEGLEINKVELESISTAG